MKDCALGVRLATLIFMVLVALPVLSQKIRPFEGTFYNKEYDVTIRLNLYDTVVVVPNYEFLGNMNGCYQGDIHETWFVTTFSMKDGNAVVHFSNEMGSENQVIKFSSQDSTGISYEVVGDNDIRKAVRHKWIYLPKKMFFVRMDKSVEVKPAERHFRQY